MSHSATRSLIWKEYREHRGMWIAFFLTVLVLQMVMGFLDDSQDGSTFYFAVCLGIVFSLIYALAIGAMSCIPEAKKESSSFLAQQLFSSWRFVSIRFACGSFSSVFLLVVQIMVYRIVAWLSNESSPYIPDDGDLFFFGSLGLLLLTKTVLWSMLFSLLFGRVFPAVSCAAIFTLGFAVLLYFPSLYFNLPDFLQPSFYLTNYPVEIMVLFFLNVAIYRKWPPGKVVFSAAFSRDTPTKKLFWKEYRAQRGFWFSILLISIVLQIVLLISLDPSTRPFGERGKLDFIANIGIAFTLMYAVACGVTMFGAEREDDSAKFLRNLPIAHWRMIFTRFAFGTVSTLALLFVQVSALFLLTFVLNGIMGPGLELLWLFFLGLSLFIIKSVLWGIFFSLLFSRVMVSVVSASIVVFGMSLVQVSIGDGLKVLWYFDFWPHSSSIVDFLTIVILFFLNVAMYRKWSRGELKFQWFQLGFEKKQANVWQKILIRRKAISYNRNSLRSLLWLSRKEVLSASLIPVSVAGAISMVSYLIAKHIEFDFSIVIIPFIPIFMGVWVYRENHLRNTNRFCAERGISPGKFWITKQLVWFSATLMIYFVFFWVDICFEKMFVWERFFVPFGLDGSIGKFHIDFTKDHFTDSVSNTWNVLKGNFHYCLFAYSCAMWCSHWFRRTITAFAAAVVMTVLLHLWWFYMNWFELPIFWTVYPLVAAMFLSSFLSTQNWLLERGRLLRAVRTTALLAGTFATVVFGVGWYRVASAPEVVDKEYYRQYLPPPPTEYELETGRMYRRASESLVSLLSIENRLAKGQTKTTDADEKYAYHGWAYATNAERVWLEENREAIELVLIASKRKTCAMENPYAENATPFYERNSPLTGKLESVIRLLLYSARKLESEGKLKEAWTYYLAATRMCRHLAKYPQYFFNELMVSMYWSEAWRKHPLQKTEYLQKAFIDFKREDITETIKVGESAAIALMQIERFKKNAIEGRKVRNSHASGLDYFMKRAAAFLMPWEKTRALRLIDSHNQREFYAYVAYEREAKKGWSRSDENDTTESIGNSYTRIADLRSDNSFDLHSEFDFLTLRLSQSNYWSIFQNKINLNLIRLALSVEKRKTDKLPERLEDLCGGYFEELPVDPWSGESYKYYHKGLLGDILYVDFQGDGGVIEANTPFIFTPAAVTRRWRDRSRLILIPEDAEDNKTGKDYYIVFESIDEIYETLLKTMSTERTIRRTIHVIEN